MNEAYQLAILGAGLTLIGKIVWDWLQGRNGNGKTLKVELIGPQAELLRRLEQWHFGARMPDGTPRPEDVQRELLQKLEVMHQQLADCHRELTRR